MATLNSSIHTSNKRVTRTKKMVVDPIVDAHARLRAAGKDDTARAAAFHDLETLTPTTKRGADIMAAHVRYLQRISKGEIYDTSWTDKLSEMLERSRDCRRRLRAN